MTREEWIAKVREQARKALADGVLQLEVPILIDGDIGKAVSSTYALVNDREEAERLYDLVAEHAVTLDFLLGKLPGSE